MGVQQVVVEVLEVGVQGSQFEERIKIFSEIILQNN